MTSEEMTTGSVSATPAERQFYAFQSRWWNSTGGGSSNRSIPGIGGSTTNIHGRGNVKAGDGGEKFRREWPELDEQNWKYLQDKKIDPKTGRAVVDYSNAASCTPGADALKRAGNSAAGIGAVGQQARDAGQGWLGSRKVMVAVVAVVAYALLARLLRD